MTRIGFLKKYALRLLSALVLLGLIFYTVYHALDSSSANLLTAPARRVTDVRYISGSGAVFREETVLTVPSAGLISDLAESGTKVGKGVTLAEVYPVEEGEDTETRQTLLDRLDRMLSVLDASVPPEGSGLSSADKWKKEADALSLTLRKLVESGNYSDVSERADEMLILLNRREILTGDAAAIDETRTAARAMREELLTGEGQPVISENSSGYYFDRFSVDGYESVCTDVLLRTLDCDGLRALRASGPNDPADRFTVGKEVFSYVWQLAVGVTAEEAELFAIGEAYPVSFPESGDLTVTMRLCEIRPGDGENLLLFRSEEIGAGTSVRRFPRAEIAVSRLSGFTVPEKALHEHNGDTGVYVLDGSIVAFRKVEILYRGDGYCIVRETGESGYLALNDLMILSGKNLYDGKVYQ